MDRISYLPDELRHQILSRISFSEATRMSCLSRRWRNVCRSLSNLSFDEVEMYSVSQEKSFEDFVSQTLDHHDESDIERFNLILDIGSVSPVHVNSWISSAVSHNVKSFCLYPVHGGIWDLPLCLLTCKTLRVLMLYNIKLSLPETIGFPKIEELRLSGVEFTNEKCANHLLSSCLHLKVLFIGGSEMNKISTLRISGDNLKSVTFENLYKPEIEISAPNLHNICYSGKLPKMSVETLSSLYTVDFVYFPRLVLPPLTRDAHCQRINDIIMGLHNISRMTLRGLFIEFLSLLQASLALQSTSHLCLEHLQLYLHPSKRQLLVIILLLTHSPRLERLSLDVKRNFKCGFMLNMGGSWQLQRMGGYWQLQGMSPEERPLNRLKTIDIQNFEGSDVQLNLVKYLIENADSLEKIEITYSLQLRDDNRKVLTVNSKISSFTKASPSAVISCN